MHSFMFKRMFITKTFSFLFFLLMSFQLLCQDDTKVLQYVGSSTIGNFISDANQHYSKVRFNINTEDESSGGEVAILNNNADLVGIARVPSPEVLGKGLVSTLIGWDAIAVIVNEEVGVDDISFDQLRGIFTGKIKNWKELGGAELPIKPFIVSQESATRKIFRSKILGAENYLGCEMVQPDSFIIEKVQNQPGAIGHISFSFLQNLEKNVKILSVNQQALNLNNHWYPITRPLYFLHRNTNTEVDEFVNWTLSEEGQTLLKKKFIGAVESDVQQAGDNGSLIVYTSTKPVEDGGIFYYPHNPYQILSPEGKLMLRVPNHLGNNDESPTKIFLNPGKYIIKPEDGNEEYFVTIEANRLTKLDLGEYDPDTPPITTSESSSADGLFTSKGVLEKLNHIKFYGDLRIRGEFDNTELLNRFRGRMRIRVGLAATLSPGFKLDFRVASSQNPDTPKSTHINLSNNFSQIRLVIDRAYLLFTPKKISRLNLWLGKFSHPFRNSKLYYETLWDDDLQPEGTAAALSNISLSNFGKLRVVQGFYLLENILSSQNNHSLSVSQLAFDFNLSSTTQLSVLSGYSHYSNIKGSATSYNKLGINTSNCVYSTDELIGKDTVAIDRFCNNFYILDNTLLLDWRSDWQLIRFKGQWIENFGAESDRSAYVVGVQIGEFKMKKDWTFFYQFQKVEQEAVFTSFAQDDLLDVNAYQAHMLSVSYVIFNQLSLQLWYALSQSEGDTFWKSRTRIDLNLKF